jgi:hypothetical protein
MSPDISKWKLFQVLKEVSRPILIPLSTIVISALWIGTQRLACCSHAQLIAESLFGRRMQKQSSTCPSFARSKNWKQILMLSGTSEETNSQLVLLQARFMLVLGINSLDFGWRQLKTRKNLFTRTALSLLDLTPCRAESSHRLLQMVLLSSAHALTLILMPGAKQDPSEVSTVKRCKSSSNLSQVAGSTPCHSPLLETQWHTQVSLFLSHIFLAHDCTVHFISFTVEEV